MLRSRLILAAAAAGLAAGALAWWAAGGPGANLARLEPPEAKLAKLRAPRSADGSVTPADASQLAANPLFLLTTGPGATPPPNLRLDGVSRSKARVAALLSVNDQPAEWLVAGDSRGGVTLQSVTASKAVVDTIYGPQDVGLGERTGGVGPAAAPGTPPSAPAATPTGGVQPTIMDRPPPGFRSPPPPASAPGSRR